MLNKFLKKHQGHFWAVTRILVGLLFWQHGAQKLLGLFGATAQPAFSLMWVVGIVEFFGGLLIAVGLLTQFAAAASAIVMIGAYFKAHFPKSLIPISNGGELALVYLAVFLAIFAYGAGPWALDNVFGKKKKKHH